MRRERKDVPYIVVERENSTPILPFLWGALIGGGIALLFAPRTGYETRAEITSGARRLRRAAEDKVRDVQDTVSEAVDGVRHQVAGRVSVARNAFDAGRVAARESRADMERRIREARLGFEAGAAAARAGVEFEEELVDDEIV